MNTVRKILVPVDFSEDSANGLIYSLSLAQKTQAELIVLHVTQKSEADSFLDLLAVMEGAPMLNRRVLRQFLCFAVALHLPVTALSASGQSSSLLTVDAVVD